MHSIAAGQLPFACKTIEASALVCTPGVSIETRSARAAAVEGRQALRSGGWHTATAVLLRKLSNNTVKENHLAVAGAIFSLPILPIFSIFMEIRDDQY
jgi:hypothetical protein